VRYGVLVDGVTLTVVAWEPVRSASLAPMRCWNAIAIAWRLLHVIGGWPPSYSAKMTADVLSPATRSRTRARPRLDHTGRGFLHLLRRVPRRRSPDSSSGTADRGGAARRVRILGNGAHARRLGDLHLAARQRQRPRWSRPRRAQRTMSMRGQSAEFRRFGSVSTPPLRLASALPSGRKQRSS